MDKRPMTVDELWALPRVGMPAPSPDGQFVIVPVTRYSMETNLGTTRLWMIPADARRAGHGDAKDPARPLTGAGVSSSQPAVSPDGRSILFVRKHGSAVGKHASSPKYGDKPQIHLLSLEGGEPERLTDLPLGAEDPRWFPDGQRIAFIAPVYRVARTIDETAKWAKQRAEDPVKAHVTEDRVYRYWDKWLTEGMVHHIFALDLATRTLVDLTPDSERWFDPMDATGQYSIAPDGREIAFAACRVDPPYDPVLWGMFSVKVPVKLDPEVKAPPVRDLTPKGIADAGNPCYSPDGRWIVYGMKRRWDFWADKQRISVYDRKLRQHHVLTEEWDRTAVSWVVGPDSRTIYVQADDRGRSCLFSFDLVRAVKRPAEVKPKRVVRGGGLCAPRLGGNRLYYTRASLSAPPEICSYDARTSRLREVSGFTDPGMSQLAIGEVEEQYFIGAEGRSIQMWVVHPPSAREETRGSRRAARRLPLVHLIHGGPHGAFNDDWTWRWNAQTFVAPGYRAALVNFHGSTGWGQKFTSSILGRWGDQPYKDIMAATDHLIAQGLVDPTRMAATGGSYGGYLASWIASQTDRFTCIVNHAGVADLHGQLGSDITQDDGHAFGGALWGDLEGLDRYNPVRHAKGFRSPMLIIHGELDYRVPYGEALTCYNTYKALGLPARFICYPDENHWILKPRNSRHWYGEVLEWLDRWFLASKSGILGGGPRRKAR